jgi:hypothetical protein
MSEPLPTDETAEQSEREEIRTILAKRIRMIDAHLEEMELESPEDQKLAIKWTRTLGSLSGQHRLLTKDADIDEMQDELELLQRAKEVTSDE